jgi:hypothetical protein
MPAEVKYKPHHSGNTPEQRIASRLRNSGGDGADHVVQKGDGPNRTFSNLWHSGHKIQEGTAARESGPMEQHRHDPATTQGVGYSPKGGGGGGR